MILPEAQTWLSFSITIPLRSCLCMDTPPTSMAYFSTNRKPGVVFRVPATCPCHPAFEVMYCSLEQRVAIPEARARQLRAGLSPRRTHLAGPLTTAVGVTAPGPGGVRLLNYVRPGFKFMFAWLWNGAISVMFSTTNMITKNTFSVGLLQVILVLDGISQNHTQVCPLLVHPFHSAAKLGKHCCEKGDSRQNTTG